ncbi:hypothetical protein ACL07V_11025 [Streptomyces sp. MB22_4]|uniref:hypothetical protein n=1 Tax=Streptomyces sp. MB22_4 TaxID=3383120 RepID=UPI0039A00DF8
MSGPAEAAVQALWAGAFGAGARSSGARAEGPGPAGVSGTAGEGSAGAPVGEPYRGGFRDGGALPVDSPVGKPRSAGASVGGPHTYGTSAGAPHTYGTSAGAPQAYETSAGAPQAYGTSAGVPQAYETSAGRPDDRVPPPAAPGTPGGGARKPSSAPGTDPARRAVPRRGTGDPVKALLHRHRDLCERAVDPLEIAAGLEAQGITDRTAARFRHRDVFSLAEELYARVPRGGEPRPEPEPPMPVPPVRARWALSSLLPGVAGAATVAGTRLTQGQPRLLVAVAGIVALALATRAALRTGPLAGPYGSRAPLPGPRGPRPWTLWLLGYALFGDGLLHDVLTGGPDALPDGAPGGDWPTATVPVLALTLSIAPAAWCAHLLTAGARRRLAGSRGLAEFTAAARPLLVGTFALFLGALAALLLLCGKVLKEPAAYPQALTLGALLLLARLLTVHRYRRAPALVLGAAAATEAAALALPLAGRLPHLGFLAVPVRSLVDTLGEPAVPALTCGIAALTLLLHATRTLTRASAHAPTGAPE